MKTADRTLLQYLRFYAAHPDKFLSLLPAGQATPATDVLDRVIRLLVDYDAPTPADPSAGGAHE